jgi:hypothetical protein
MAECNRGKGVGDGGVGVRRKSRKRGRGWKDVGRGARVRVVKFGNRRKRAAGNRWDWLGRVGEVKRRRMGFWFIVKPDIVV